MTPVMEQLAVELKGRAKVGRLDIDVGKRTATEYRIYTIPVTLVFKNGEVVDQVMGITSRHELLKRIDALAMERSSHSGEKIELSNQTLTKGEEYD